VLGAGIAVDLFGEQDPLGQSITVGSTKLTIIGVMESKGIVSDVDYDGRIYMPINLVFQKYMNTSNLRGDRVRTIYVKAESQEKIESVIDQITALLATRHDVDMSNPDFPSRLNRTSSALRKRQLKHFVTCWHGWLPSRSSWGESGL